MIALRRSGHHRASRHRRSRECDEVDARVAGKLRADTVIAGCHDVEHAGRQVGFLRHDPAQFGGAPGRIGCGLEDNRVACRHGRTDLGQVDLVRKIPRRDGADDTERLSHDRATARDAERCGDTEIGSPRICLGDLSWECQIVDGYLELTTVGQGDRRAHLGDGDVAQQLDLRVQRIAQLAQAMHPELGVPGPVGLVERDAGGRDGAVHVGGVAVGRGAERLFRRRVDGGDRSTAARQQFTVDQQRCGLLRAAHGPPCTQSRGRNRHVARA